MNYTLLSKEIHEEQVRMGWYDTYRSDNLLIKLINSEQNEAFEAIRKNPRPKPSFFSYNMMLENYWFRGTEDFVPSFEKDIKDSFADELADIAIRVFDFAGYKGLAIHEVKTEEIKDVFDSLIDLEIFLIGLYFKDVSENQISKIIAKVEAIARVHSINLKEHINLKLAYNKTRGKRHGNKTV